MPGADKANEQVELDDKVIESLPLCKTDELGESLKTKLSKGAGTLIGGATGLPFGLAGAGANLGKDLGEVLGKEDEDEKRKREESRNSHPRSDKYRFFNQETLDYYEKKVKKYHERKKSNSLTKRDETLKNMPKSVEEQKKRNNTIRKFAASVGKFISKKGNIPSGSCTATLIAVDKVMLNAHCLGGKDEETKPEGSEAGEDEVCFGFTNEDDELDDKDQNELTEQEENEKEKGKCFSIKASKKDGDLDMAILTLNDGPIEEEEKKKPGTIFGCVTLAKKAAEPLTPTAIVHHASGEELKISYAPGKSYFAGANTMPGMCRPGEGQRPRISPGPGKGKRGYTTDRSRGGASGSFTMNVLTGEAILLNNTVSDNTVADRAMGAVIDEDFKNEISGAANTEGCDNKVFKEYEKKNRASSKQNEQEENQEQDAKQE